MVVGVADCFADLAQQVELGGEWDALRMVCEPEVEAAEARLFEMGPVAVPVLEDALIHKDVEIVFRAERLLLRLNRPVP